MGEIAEDMYSGAACAQCGVYFVKEHGHPVLCTGCHRGQVKRQVPKRNRFPQTRYREL